MNMGYSHAVVLQSGTHTIRTQFRTIHHQLAHLLDFPDSRFARMLLRKIIESRMAEPGPVCKHFIHPMARRLEIGANARIRPALRASIDNGLPSKVTDRRSGHKENSAAPRRFAWVHQPTPAWTMWWESLRPKRT
jgi:hypothetical protein